MERYKFPRTPHLPWSPGFSGDDVRLASLDHFSNKTLIITEKLDGENITVYSDGYVHARSIDGTSHPSRDYFKGTIKSKLRKSVPNFGYIPVLPDGWRACFEYLYAIHSIEYERLPSYIFLIGIVDQFNNAMDWDIVKLYSNYFEVPTVPEISIIESGDNWEHILRDKEQTIMAKSKFGSTIEGYVIRNYNGFSMAEYGKNVAKYVRAGHVVSEDHWTKNWKRATIYKELS